MRPPDPLAHKINGEELAALCRKDAEGFARISVSSFSEMETDRLPFIGGLRAVVPSVLLENVRKDAGQVVEMGAGRGFLYRELVPEGLKGVWRQFEINEGLIRSAKANFGLAIPHGNAYEQVVPPKSTDAWIGYSSYDSITFLEAAFARIREGLTDDGILCLIQDVMPPSSPAVGYCKYGLGSRNVEAKLCGCPWNQHWAVLRDGEFMDQQLDLEERYAEALGNQGFTIIRQGLEAGVYVGPKESRHEFQIGGIIQKGNFTVNTGRPAERVIRNYNIWDRGDHSQFDTFEVAKLASSSPTRDRIIRRLMELGASFDEYYETERLPGLGERIMGRILRRPKKEIPRLESESYRLTPESPLRIVPQSILDANGFVQEIAVVGVTVAKIA